MSIVFNFIEDYFMLSTKNTAVYRNVSAIFLGAYATTAPCAIVYVDLGNILLTSNGSVDLDGGGAELFFDPNQTNWGAGALFEAGQFCPTTSLGRRAGTLSSAASHTCAGNQDRPT